MLGDDLVSVQNINKCYMELEGMDGYSPIFWRGVEFFKHHFLHNIRQLFDLCWSADIFDHINLDERHFENDFRIKERVLIQMEKVLDLFTQVLLKLSSGFGHDVYQKWINPSAEPKIINTF